MTVKMITAHIINIILSPIEAAGLFAGRSLENINDADLLRTIRLIIKSALPETDFFLRHKDAFIRTEFVRGEYYITVTGVPVKRYKRAESPKKAYILEFANSTDLMDAVEQLYRNEKTRNIKSDLYSLGGLYRLLLYSDNEQFFQIRHLFDYADRILTCITDAAKTAEYGKLITKNRAVEKMGKYLI